MKLLNFLTQSSSKEDVEESLDYTRLQRLFTELTAHKDDSQQRGWALHEDESIITSILEEILSILVSEPFSYERPNLQIIFLLFLRIELLPKSKHPLNVCFENVNNKEKYGPYW